VRQNEAVHAHHHRQRELFCQLERLDMHVRRFLIGLGKNLDPATVALAHRIRVIIPDVDRRTDGTVCHRHHDRQAEARGVVDGLNHEQQALRSRCGISARAGGR